MTVTTMEGPDRAEAAAYELVQQSSGMTAATLSGTEGDWTASFATDVLAGLAAYQNGNLQEPELTALWEAAAANAVELSSYKGNDPVKRQALATNLGTSVFALGAYYQSR